MACTTSECPNPQCTHYGQRGFGAHRVRRGVDRGIPRLLCPRCAGTCAARQGTAYCGARTEEPHDTLAMPALAEGNSFRGTGRIVEIAQETVCVWRDRAGRPWRAVTPSWCDPWQSTAYQGDAWWSCVCQQEAPLTGAEPVRARYGDAWGGDRLRSGMATGGRLCGERNATRSTPTCSSNATT
jgi:hypothetical protein